MDDKNDNKKPVTPITPHHYTLGGTSGERGTQDTYAFTLTGSSEEQRDQVFSTVARLIEEHDSPSKIIYTTRVGHLDADGSHFAEVMLLPVGDTIRITLGQNTPDGEEGQVAEPVSNAELRRAAIYLFSAYLALAYDVSPDEVRRLCDLADEEADATGSPGGRS